MVNFWATYRKKWITIYCNIWSHWLLQTLAIAALHFYFVFCLKTFFLCEKKLFFIQLHGKKWNCDDHIMNGKFSNQRSRMAKTRVESIFFTGSGPASFFKNGQPLSLFQTHITNFTTNRYVKNVHPVCGAGIRTHNLWNMISSHNH